jgi:hypothetical protein
MAAVGERAGIVIVVIARSVATKQSSFSLLPWIASPTLAMTVVDDWDYVSK